MNLLLALFLLTTMQLPQDQPQEDDEEEDEIELIIIAEDSEET